MKTRKIRGGIFGRETTKQMECLIELIKYIIAKNKEINDSDYISNNVNDEINAFNYNQRHSITKTLSFFRLIKNSKSDYEKIRDRLLEILLGPLKLFDNMYFNSFEKLLEDIKDHNNKGSYYTIYNTNNTTTYTNNYDLFSKEYCNKKDIFLKNLTHVTTNLNESQSSSLNTSSNSASVNLSALIDSVNVNDLLFGSDSVDSEQVISDQKSFSSGISSDNEDSIGSSHNSAPTIGEKSSPTIGKLLSSWFSSKGGKRKNKSNKKKKNKKRVKTFKRRRN